MKKVFVVNKSYHDFSEAERFGEVIFLSDGSMDRYAVNNMARMFQERMKDSSENDYLVPCSLNAMNSVASAIFAKKHGKLNLLLYKHGRGYIERNLVL